MTIRYCDCCRQEISTKTFPILLWRKDPDETHSWDLCVECATTKLAEILGSPTQVIKRKP